MLAKYDSGRKNTTFFNYPVMVKIIKLFISRICENDSFKSIKQTAKNVKRVYEVIIALAKTENKKKNKNDDHN